MSVVIDLGLEPLYPDVEERSEALRSFVEAGLSVWIREVFGEGRELQGGRVLEARLEDGRAVGRWLPAAAAEPILAAVREVYGRHGSYASFSWREAELLGVALPELALRLDGPADGEVSFELPGIGHRPQVRDIDGCWLPTRGGRRVDAARALLRLATKRRLILHCAWPCSPLRPLA